MLQTKWDCLTNSNVTNCRSQMINTGSLLHCVWSKGSKIWELLSWEWDSCHDHHHWSSSRCLSTSWSRIKDQWCSWESSSWMPSWSDKDWESILIKDCDKDLPCYWTVLSSSKLPKSSNSQFSVKAPLLSIRLVVILISPSYYVSILFLLLKAKCCRTYTPT